jgi:hypothetical protein
MYPAPRRHACAVDEMSDPKLGAVSFRIWSENTAISTAALPSYRTSRGFHPAASELGTVQSLERIRCTRLKYILTYGLPSLSATCSSHAEYSLELRAERKHAGPNYSM